VKLIFKETYLTCFKQ